MQEPINYSADRFPALFENFNKSQIKADRRSEALLTVGRVLAALWVATVIGGAVLAANALISLF